jgi:hypothetical protein
MGPLGGAVVLPDIISRRGLRFALGAAPIRVRFGLFPIFGFSPLNLFVRHGEQATHGGVEAPSGFRAFDHFGMGLHALTIT